MNLQMMSTKESRAKSQALTMPHCCLLDLANACFPVSVKGVLPTEGRKVYASFASKSSDGKTCGEMCCLLELLEGFFIRQPYLEDLQRISGSLAFLINPFFLMLNSTKTGFGESQIRECYF